MFNSVQAHKMTKVNEAIDFLIWNVFEKVDLAENATKLKAAWRGKKTREEIKDPDFWKQRHKKTLEIRGNMKAALLMQRLWKGVIARRRVKKAKAERAAKLKEQGIVDDTEEKIFLFEFPAGSMGMKTRAGAGEEGKEWIEVASVKEDGVAEKATVKAGDKILEINGEPFAHFRKLKKKIKECLKLNDGKITIKFERAEKLKLYTTGLINNNFETKEFDQGKVE